MKINKLIIIIFSFLGILFSENVNSQVVQEWERTFHGPANGGGIRIMTTHNDYIYVAGQDADPQQHMT